MNHRLSLERLYKFQIWFQINHVTPEIFPETVCAPLSPLNGGLNVFHEQSHQLKGCSRFSFHFSLTTMPQIAVVLSGCGVYDGTEVHEAAAALGKGKEILKIPF